ncbi:hypothetical protein Lal_00002080 [Lupinus albus]|nr:hypothetical protein Lal_00002080 [Lupinus albus]
MKRSAGDYDGEETIMTYAVTGEGERTDHHPSAGPGSASPTKKKRGKKVKSLPELLDIRIDRTFFNAPTLASLFSFFLISYPEVSPSFLVAAALSVEVKSEEQAQGDEAAHHTSLPIPWTPLAPSSQSLVGGIQASGTLTPNNNRTSSDSSSDSDSDSSCKLAGRFIRLGAKQAFSEVFSKAEHDVLLVLTKNRYIGSHRSCMLLISSSPEASKAKETTSTASPVPRLLLSKDRRQPRSKKALGDRPHHCTRDSWIGSCTGRAAAILAEATQIGEPASSSAEVRQLVDHLSEQAREAAYTLMDLTLFTFSRSLYYITSNRSDGSEFKEVNWRDPRLSHLRHSRRSKLQVSRARRILSFGPWRISEFLFLIRSLVLTLILLFPFPGSLNRGWSVGSFDSSSGEANFNHKDFTTLLITFTSKIPISTSYSRTDRDGGRDSLSQGSTAAIQ